MTHARTSGGDKAVWLTTDLAILWVNVLVWARRRRGARSGHASGPGFGLGFVDYSFEMVCEEDNTTVFRRSRYVMSSAPSIFLSSKPPESRKGGRMPPIRRKFFDRVV